mmetsp:Transcript_4238/g.13741  ORF Transcript_4238/g.13741 Transcript_4238/m.13741 type:complete len:249 (-) Transcript_4238:213-959(-)
MSASVCSRIATGAPPVTSGGRTKSSTYIAACTCTPCRKPSASSAPDTSRSVAPGACAVPCAASAARKCDFAHSWPAVRTISAGSGGASGSSSWSISAASATRQSCAGSRKAVTRAASSALSSSACECCRKASNDHRSTAIVCGSANATASACSTVHASRSAVAAAGWPSCAHERSTLAASPSSTGKPDPSIFWTSPSGVTPSHASGGGTARTAASPCSRAAAECGSKTAAAPARPSRRGSSPTTSGEA